MKFQRPNIKSQTKFKESIINIQTLFGFWILPFGAY
jgi:hypothetical protein